MSLADLLRQLGTLIGLPAVLLAGAGSLLIVIPRDWRANLFGYALVSVMLSLLLMRGIPGGAIPRFPTEWALLQTIVGGLIAVILFLSARQLHWVPGAPGGWATRFPVMASLTSFRALALGLAAVVFFAVHKQVTLPGLDALFRDAVLWLTLTSLMGLALHEEPMHAGLCLLVFLGGAELLLFTLVQDRTLVGIWFGTQLLLGLAAAYLVMARGLAVPRSGAPEFDSDDAANGARGDL